jgi:hypothetical protein
MRIAIAEGEITADDLLADWLVATEDARLNVDHSTIGPLVWRLGAGAYRRYLLGELDARAVADGIVPRGGSALARDLAVSLLRARGGDALERAAFAWLFATGEPQEGLAAFLAKRTPRF